MAVYQIFASADATIYSRYPIKNTGRDEVLEVSVKNSQDGVAFYNKQQLLTQNPYYTYDLAANDNYSTTDELFPESDIRRAVLQFSNTDITKLKTFASQSVSGSYEANLKLSLAFAQNLNTTYSLQAYALTQSWTMGTGRFAQVPQSTNGVSWLYTGPSASSAAWTTGGGSWNTALTGTEIVRFAPPDVMIAALPSCPDLPWSGRIQPYYFARLFLLDCAFCFDAISKRCSSASAAVALTICRNARRPLSALGVLTVPSQCNTLPDSIACTDARILRRTRRGTLTLSLTTRPVHICLRPRRKIFVLAGSRIRLIPLRTCFAMPSIRTALSPPEKVKSSAYRE